MPSLMHVGHWRFAEKLQPAVSHVRFTKEVDIVLRAVKRRAFPDTPVENAFAVNVKIPENRADVQNKIVSRARDVRRYQALLLSFYRP